MCSNVYNNGMNTNVKTNRLYLRCTNFLENGKIHWEAFRKNDDVCIASCNLEPYSLFGKQEFLFRCTVNKGYQNFGYEKEIVREISQFVFAMFNRPIYILLPKNKANIQDIIMDLHLVNVVVDDPYFQASATQIYTFEYVKGHVYIDCEFDAIKMDGKYHQSLISIGAILCDDKMKVLDTYYETIHPQGFKGITPIVLKMTKLTSKDIFQSRSLQEVMTSFCKWINRYFCIDECRFYSFGPDDGRTLRRHCIREQVVLNDVVLQMEDLQKEISKDVREDGEVVSEALSLDRLKLIYKIDGGVEHNALTDAVDLMKVHQCYISNMEMDQEVIHQIVEEQNAKRKQRLYVNIQKRVKGLRGSKVLKLYPEVKQAMFDWRQKANLQISVRDDCFVYDGNYYDFGIFDIYEEEQVYFAKFMLFYKKISVEVLCPITYQNISFVEQIALRLKHG